MKAFLSKKTIVIAAIAVLIAIITIVSVNVFNSDGPVTGLAGVVARPFKSLAASVAQTFESIYSSINRYDDLQKKYEKALKDLNDIQRDYHELEEIREENNTLRALMHFRERHADHVYEEAIVVKMSSAANWTSSFIISKGYANSDTAIARGNCVITEYGVLVGVVTDVGAVTSTVASVLDTTFSASAHVGDSDVLVTAKGDFSLMNSGLLMIDHLSEDLVVLPGDSVVTSSSAGLFPIGLVIGEVVEVLRHDTGVGRYATVSPVRTIDNTLSDVYVITSFDIYG